MRRPPSDALCRWSVDRPEAFWPAFWRFAGLEASRPWDQVLAHGDRMPGSGWFEGARLNFAENMLRHRDDHPAIIAWTEDCRRQTVTYKELYLAVARLAVALKAGRRRRRRPGRRGDAARHRDDRRHARGHLDRRDLVLLLPRFRQAGPAGSLRPDRAQGADLRRRLPLQRQAPGHFFEAAGACGRAADARTDRPGALPQRRRQGGRPEERGSLRRLHRQRCDRCRLRAAAVRPSGLHPLFVGHHRRAQGDRARHRRHAPAAPEGADAAHRPQARGQALLLHHLRLDDVELAGERARPRGDGRHL